MENFPNGAIILDVSRFFHCPILWMCWWTSLCFRNTSISWNEKFPNVHPFIPYWSWSSMNCIHNAASGGKCWCCFRFGCQRNRCSMLHIISAVCIHFHLHTSLLWLLWSKRIYSVMFQHQDITKNERELAWLRQHWISGSLKVWQNVGKWITSNWTCLSRPSVNESYCNRQYYENVQWCIQQSWNFETFAQLSKRKWMTTAFTNIPIRMNSL